MWGNKTVHHNFIGGEGLCLGEKITVYIVILSLILGKVANRLYIAFILMVRYEVSGFREQATVASRLGMIPN
jgi:hypothetical protein